MFGEVSDHQEGFYPLELRGLLILNKSLTFLIPNQLSYSCLYL